MSKAVKKRLGRIVVVEYQAYIIECLRHNIKALKYEDWIKKFGESK